MPNKNSLLPLSRICPTAVWPFKCLWKMWARGMGSRSQGQGTPIFSVLFLLVVSSSIIFFSWAFQGCCSCLAGNFCSPATSCHHSTLLTQQPGREGGMTPSSPSARRSVHGGSLLAQVRGMRKWFEAAIFASNARVCSFISGKQEPAVLEQRTSLSPASTLKPSSVLIWDKFY